MSVDEKCMYLDQEDEDGFDKCQSNNHCKYKSVPVLLLYDYTERMTTTLCFKRNYEVNDERN